MSSLPCDFSVLAGLSQDVLKEAIQESFKPPEVAIFCKATKFECLAKLE